MPEMRASRGGCAVLGLVLMLGACGTTELFGTYDLPESDDVAAAPWPRLVDVPAAPARGDFTDAVPDPARGILLETDLGAAAANSALRAEELGQPVLDDAALRRLGAAPREAEARRQE